MAETTSVAEESETLGPAVDRSARVAVPETLSRLYLQDDHLAVFEVAFLLGYSEPSAFNRAFRRWTGSTPSEFRRSQAR